MNVQRFIGKDNSDAMLKVKRELGSEAVILHTRKIKQKGLKRFFAKPLVEVVAAIEEKPPVKKTSNEGEGAKLLAEMRSLGVDTKRSGVNKTNAALSAYQKKPIDNRRATSDEGEFKELKSEISELKSMISRVSLQVNQGEAQSPFMQQQYIQNLRAHGIVAEILSDLEQRFFEQGLNINDDEAVKQFLTIELKQMLGDSYDADNAASGQKIYYFVGPTGVGKTTTIAKIAAKLALIDKKKVSLITADTYRIAAVDQLKTYGEILSIPLDVVYEADDLDAVLANKTDCDYILIDTAGRNHKDEAMRADLEELLARTDKRDVFLVMSCTSSVKDIKLIIKSYQFIDDYHLIFTKLDEAESHGNLLNGKILSEKDLAFFTLGQSVPDDIEPASAEKVVELLLEEISE